VRRPTQRLPAALPNGRIIQWSADFVAIVPFWDYTSCVRIIALSTLKAFWEGSSEYRDAKEPGLAWYRHTLKADWAAPADVKAEFRNCSILRDGRVVFNIAGNKYRLVAWINYPYRVVYVRFIGTHAQYDEIDAQTI
jgi:mRNA interferase HigB